MQGVNLFYQCFWDALLLLFLGVVLRFLFLYLAELVFSFMFGRVKFVGFALLDLLGWGFFEMLAEVDVLFFKNSSLN